MQALADKAAAIERQMKEIAELQEIKRKAHNPDPES